MSKLAVEALRKSFCTKGTSANVELGVLAGISFTVKDGEFITFFGPNGCGKTTLLNIISGILPPDAGTVRIDNKDVSDARIGYIFQNYVESLFPWSRAIGNMSLPLKLRGMPPAERQSRVRDLLGHLRISLPLDSYPYELSGGQKQLVAIVRALLFDPDLLVMDEPFSALDHETRFSMQSKIQDVWTDRQLTILFVSHEIDEAIFLADKLFLLTKRPAMIRRVFEIALPRPRTHDMLESEEFFELKRAVLREFRELMVESGRPR
jgi:NitT/TauT family transport system ATP-binding protein